MEGHGKFTLENSLTRACTYMAITNMPIFSRNTLSCLEILGYKHAILHMQSQTLMQRCLWKRQLPP